MDDRIINEVMKCRRWSVCRVYLYLNSLPRLYNSYVVIRPTQLERNLNLSHRTVYKALKYLTESGYITRHNVDGNNAYKLVTDLKNVETVEHVTQKLSKEIDAKQTLLASIQALITGSMTVYDGDDGDAPNEEMDSDPDADNIHINLEALNQGFRDKK